MKFKLALALICTLFFCNANATTVLYQDFNQLIDNSQHVVVGKVKKVKVKKAKKDGEIYTTILLQNAYTVESGGPEPLNSTVKIRFKGGQIEIKDKNGKGIGTEGYELVGAPKLEEGDKVLLFVENNGVADMPIYGWGQGVFKIDDSESIKDVRNNPVVGFDGADIISNTPEGLMARGQLLSQENTVSSVQSSAQPSIITTDGGEDTPITPVEQQTTKLKKSSSLLPIHSSNFVSMIQERKAINESKGLKIKGAKQGKGFDKRSLTDVPEIEEFNFAEDAASSQVIEGKAPSSLSKSTLTAVEETLEPVLPKARPKAAKKQEQ